MRSSEGNVQNLHPYRQMVNICSFALSIYVRHLSAGKQASPHHIEQRRQVHLSLAAAVRSENDTLAADRCGSVLSARMIIVVCSTMSLMLDDWRRGSEASPKTKLQCIWNIPIGSCLSVNSYLKYREIINVIWNTCLPIMRRNWSKNREWK